MKKSEPSVDDSEEDEDDASDEIKDVKAFIQKVQEFGTKDRPVRKIPYNTDESDVLVFVGLRDGQKVTLQIKIRGNSHLKETDSDLSYERFIYGSTRNSLSQTGSTIKVLGEDTDWRTAGGHNPLKLVPRSKVEVQLTPDGKVVASGTIPDIQDHGLVTVDLKKVGLDNGQVQKYELNLFVDFVSRSFLNVRGIAFFKEIVSQ